MGRMEGRANAVSGWREQLRFFSVSGILVPGLLGALPRCLVEAESHFDPQILLLEGPVMLPV